MRVREFAVPLQALLFILICFSLVWMLYAMAFYDPTPPSLDEVNSDVTLDPQINDMRTSAALTVNALFGFGPTQIFLSTPTPSLSPTVTPTVISVANTITPRPVTATPTFGIEPTWTDDRTRDDPTAVPPTQNRPTATFTLRPTRTSVPPTKVPTTAVPPTRVPTTEVPATDPPTEPPTEETEPPTEETPPDPTDVPVINSTQSMP